MSESGGRIHAAYLDADRTRCGKLTDRMTRMADAFTGQDQSFEWAINHRGEGVPCGLCLRSLGADVDRRFKEAVS